MTYLLLFACLALLLPSGTEGGGATYTPPYPDVDLEVRYLTVGLANYVSVRCSWTPLPDVIATRIQLLGPQPYNRTRTRVIAQVGQTSSGITGIQDATGITLGGVLNCNSTGCKEGETIYASLKWKNYVTTWDSPVFEPFGCNLFTTYQNRASVTRRVTQLRVREDQKEGVINPTVISDKMHFRLRGGLGDDGTIDFLYMRCSATENAGLEVKSIEIITGAGQVLLVGVYEQGNLTNSMGDRARIDYQLDCAADNTANCYRSDKAYLGVIWRKMDLARDVGAEITDDYYTLECKVNAVLDGNTVTYSQGRIVRVKGGLGDTQSRILAGGK